MTNDDLYKAWHAVGADVAGLKFEDFVKHLPPQRTWVGLTDEEISILDVRYHHDNWRLIFGFAEDIETKLKELNDVR